jgi:hypothetical protein
MFEIEFLRFQEGWAPIDFNGRLFNQIGLDIRRGMPLPLLKIRCQASFTHFQRSLSGSKHFLNSCDLCHE